MPTAKVAAAPEPTFADASPAQQLARLAIPGQDPDGSLDPTNQPIRHTHVPTGPAPRRPPTTRGPRRGGWT